MNFTTSFGGPRTTLLAAVAAVAVSACGTEVIIMGGSGANGSGAANAGGNNTGGNNTGGNNTGGINTGGNNTGGNINPIDCLNAENFDPCASPGSYCSYYDAGTNEYCDAWCDDSYRWQKNCYVQPTYCYNPSLCPSVLPTNGAACPTTDECEYYDCDFPGVCGGSGYGYGSCQDGVWYTYKDCYCYQPPELCPASPPQHGSACTTTAQCDNYDCEWINQCGSNTYHYGYCSNGVWYSDGDCN